MGVAQDNRKSAKMAFFAKFWQFDTLIWIWHWFGTLTWLHGIGIAPSGGPKKMPTEPSQLGILRIFYWKLAFLVPIFPLKMKPLIENKLITEAFIFSSACQIFHCF